MRVALSLVILQLKSHMTSQMLSINLIWNLNRDLDLYLTKASFLEPKIFFVLVHDSERTKVNILSRESSRP